MESDIAVIEESIDHRQTWEIIAYIGPDRSGGEIDISACSTIRIRYINRGE